MQQKLNLIWITQAIMLKLDWAQTVGETQESYVIMSVWVWEDQQTPVYLSVTVVFERRVMLCSC